MIEIKKNIKSICSISLSLAGFTSLYILFVSPAAFAQTTFTFEPDTSHCYLEDTVDIDIEISAVENLYSAAFDILSKSAPTYSNSLKLLKKESDLG